MNVKKSITFILAVGIFLAMTTGVVITGCAKKAQEQTDEKGKPGIAYWTCGMHPSVRVTDQEYKKGKKNCPICNMPLTPVHAEKKMDIKAGQANVGSEESYYGCGVKEEGHCPHCDGGNADAACICGGHSFLTKMGKPTNCPVCGKPLKKLTKEVTGATSGVENVSISRVHINKGQAELAGVAEEPLAKRRLIKIIRTVGKIAFDPGLAVSQEEFLMALETRRKVAASDDEDVIRRADDLVAKSKYKLRLLGMSDDEISELEKEDKAQMNLVLPEDKAWVYADVYEYELSWIKTGQEVRITTTAYPGEEFNGVIKSISPVITAMTRSARVRIEADNDDMKLQPEMYADVFIEIEYKSKDGSGEVLAVPRNAVLDTGERKIVYVDAGDGTFLGREVEIGPEATASVDGKERTFYPVISGLREGDMVVTAANFLIDSQSQISPTAAAAAFGGALGDKEEQSSPPAHQH